jgi:penicillin-binding protein 1A
VNLLDLTGAFASVRAARPRLEPWGISAFGPEESGLRSLGPPSAPAQELPHHYELTRLLQDVVGHGTGRAASLDDGNVAGKTGTSQNHRDAWFVGFNQALVVGVWVGNDDGRPMEGVTGGSLPAQIWQRFVSAATPLIDHMNDPVTAENDPLAFGSVASSSGVIANQARCDQSACAAEYTSFRVLDCTYQPNAGGPRRLCEKGAPEDGQQLLTSAPAHSARDLCDRERCSRRYRSFAASTCTYQPYQGGPRRICDMQAED